MDCNNNFAAITGAIQNTYTPTSNGSYAVAVSNGRCTETSDCYTVNLSDLTELDKGKNFTCSPNPSSEVLNIVFDSAVNDMTIDLVDGFGRSVRKVNIEGLDQTHFIMDMRSLRSGIYTLRIQMDGSQYTERIVKTNGK